MSIEKDDRNVLLINSGSFKTPEFSNFVVADHFIENGRRIVSGVNIRYMDDNFRNEFIGKIEDHSGGREIRYGNLREDSSQQSIFGILGGDRKMELSLAELWYLLEKQPRGRKNGDGYLEIDDHAGNLIFMRSRTGILIPINLGYDEYEDHLAPGYPRIVGWGIFALSAGWYKKNVTDTLCRGIRVFYHD